MALLTMTNFGDTVHEIGWSGGSPGTALPAGRPGSALGSTITNPTYSLQAASSSNSYCFGCAYYYNGATWAQLEILRISLSGTVQWQIKPLLANTTSQVGLYNSAGTLVAQTTDNFPASAWLYWEFKYVPGAPGSGRIQIRCNGVVVIDWVATATLANIGPGHTFSVGNSSGGGSSKTTDAYVLDSTGAAPFNDFLGDIQIQTLLPNNNGDVNQWVGSDGNSVDNYLLVDENPSSATDYVGTALTGQSDLYQLADLTIANRDIIAVQPLVHLGKNDTGTPPLTYAQIKQASTVVKDTTPLLTAATVSTTYQSVPGQVRTVAPDGGNWTIAKVNAAQVGVST